MSAIALYRTAFRKLEEAVTEHTRVLIEQTSNTEAQMRVTQGIVRGLILASEVLEEAYKQYGDE